MSTVVDYFIVQGLAFGQDRLDKYDLDMQLHVHIGLTGTHVDMHAQYARKIIYRCPVGTFTSTCKPQFYVSLITFT